MSRDKCEININEKGLEIKGKCAAGLLELLSDEFIESVQSETEIFGCSCIDPNTGDVEQALIRNTGQSTSVSTEGIGRYCPENKLQVTYHTHPISKMAKFSGADGSVIVDRFNKGYDDGHCLAGEHIFNCIFKIPLKKNFEI